MFRPLIVQSTFFEFKKNQTQFQKCSIRLPSWIPAQKLAGMTGITNTSFPNNI
jgi:hypothetical protein